MIKSGSLLSNKNTSAHGINVVRQKSVHFLNTLYLRTVLDLQRLDPHSSDNLYKFAWLCAGIEKGNMLCRVFHHSAVIIEYVHMISESRIWSILQQQNIDFLLVRCVIMTKFSSMSIAHVFLSIKLFCLGYLIHGIKQH